MKLRAFRFLLIGLWLFGAAAPAAWAECRMHLVSHLPLSPSAGGMIIPISLNDRPARLIFDTGAFSSLLNLQAAQRLGLRTMREEETTGAANSSGFHGVISGVGGARTATAVTARTVEIGGMKARNYNFMASDADFQPADGLLSVDVIANFDVDLDYPESQVILYRPDGDCSSPAAFLRSPLYAVPLRPTGQDSRPRVNIMVNGRNVVAMIDTGAGYSAIFRHTAERVGLDMGATDAQQHDRRRGVGPQVVTSVRLKLASMSIGDLEFRNMPVDVLNDRPGDEVEMLLGAEFQRKVHLWISYSSHMLIMQYPPTASKKPGED